MHITLNYLLLSILVFKVSQLIMRLLSFSFFVMTCQTYGRYITFKVLFTKNLFIGPSWNSKNLPRSLFRNWTWWIYLPILPDQPTTSIFGTPYLQVFIQGYKGKSIDIAKWGKNVDKLKVTIFSLKSLDAAFLTARRNIDWCYLVKIKSLPKVQFKKKTGKKYI